MATVHSLPNSRIPRFAGIQTPSQVAPSYALKFRALVESINSEAAESSADGYVSNISHFSLFRHDEKPTSTAPALSSSGKPLHVGLVMTTQPQSGDISEMTDGRTECIFHSIEDKNTLLNTPAYPKSISRPSMEGGYFIQQVEGKGLGMIAMRDHSYGELITSERPLLIAPTGFQNVGFAPVAENTEGGAESQLKTAGLKQLERLLKVALGRMSEEAKESYMGLHKAGDGNRPLTDIMDSNSYPFEMVDGSASLPCSRYAAVFRDLSRINHSCSPNTIRTWDLPSLSLQIYAARPIKKGDEITTSYCDLLEPYSERKRVLAHYGVSCSCTACVNPISSTTNRLKLRSVQSNIPAILKWCSNRSLPDDLLLKPTLQLLHAIETEGLESLPCYAKVIHHLACIYLVLGNEGDSKKYTDKRRIWDRMHHEEEAGRVKKDVDSIRTALKAARSGNRPAERRASVPSMPPFVIRPSIL